MCVLFHCILYVFVSEGLCPEGGGGGGGVR